MRKLIFFSLVALYATSCSSLKQTTNTSKTLGIYGAGVIQKPVITNLKVNPAKITSNFSGTGVQNIDYLKSQAIAKAMQESNADVILEPSYEVVSNGNNVQIKVTGYAASYQNFRQLTGTDTSLLVEAGIFNYNNSDTPAEIAPEVKRKSPLKTILGIILLGAAVAAVVNAGTVI